MKKIGTIKAFSLLAALIIFFGPLFVKAAGVCTLSSDTCNSLTGSACSYNDNCFPYTYNDLLGNTKIICATISQTRNTCLTKDYTGCLASTNCRWYGAVENLPAGDNNDSNISDSDFPKLEDPLSAVASPQILLGNVINIIMGAVGSLALIMLIFGGISWMTAGGNDEKVKKSIGIIVWSVIGLAVVFLSYAIVKLLITQATL